MNEERKLATFSMIELYLLRHAESEYNETNAIIGGRSKHLHLSQRGEMQAKKTGKAFKKSGICFDYIFCSDAFRTRSTLDIILNQAQITNNPVVYSEELAEVSQGEWEGKVRNEIYTPERLAELNANPWLFKAPGGESQKEVEERMMSFISNRILSEYSAGKFLIIGHGVAIKCLLRGILGMNSQMTYKMQLENCSLTELRYNNISGWHVRYINRK